MPEHEILVLIGIIHAKSHFLRMHAQLRSHFWSEPSFTVLLYFKDASSVSICAALSQLSLLTNAIGTKISCTDTYIDILYDIFR